MKATRCEAHQESGHSLSTLFVGYHQILYELLQLLVIIFLMLVLLHQSFSQ